MELLEKIKVLTGESNEELLSLLLEEAENSILVYTNRTILPAALQCVQLELAIAAYTKRGCEGERSHSEGSVSSSFEEMPKKVFELLGNYRLAKVGGKVFEKKTL